MNTRAPFQFGLLSMLLAVSVFAVVCSFWKMAPALGLLAAVACVIGVLGVWGTSVESARRGELLTFNQKLRAFLECAGVVFLTAVGVLVGVLVILGVLWIAVILFRPAGL
jgi:hypothetical protein